MSAARWERLAASLAGAGIEASVIAEPFNDGLWRGVNRSIALRTSDGLRVEIDDKLWRKNPDVWIGWQVTLTGTDDIVICSWPLTKKRSEVAAVIVAALGKAA